MANSVRLLSASKAAERLGVTIKALRLYEQRGLITPGRTAAGYRVYGPDEMLRASEIVALRALGLSLAQVAQLVEGDRQSLESTLSAHEAILERRIRELVDSIDKIRRIRADLSPARVRVEQGLAGLRTTSTGFGTAFDLPWPWGGERFELREIRPLNYIIGPLGSGKTRLAMRLAEMLPDAAFLDLERDRTAIAPRLEADAALKFRVGRALECLIDEDATPSQDLTALLVGVEADRPAVLVVDMVEQGLDQATQEALMSYLRRRALSRERPLFLMTRSSSILNLSTVGRDEAIIFCPANHSPPTRVVPYPGAPGYEAVATCLASPEVRARIACSPQAA
jgi:DNA-binding transcriptional MerR regulator